MQNKEAYPDSGVHPETDMTKYRKHWRAGPKHFDHGRFKARDDEWVANPRRFLLAAAPQIGKTGAFLHLIYLLWQRYRTEEELEEAVQEEGQLELNDSDLGQDTPMGARAGEASEPSFAAPLATDIPAQTAAVAGKPATSGHLAGVVEANGDDTGKVPLEDLTHKEVARLAEWAMGRKWKEPHQRHSQHVAAHRLVALGLDGTVLAENADSMMEELATELKGATRRGEVHKAVHAFLQEGGVPAQLRKAWNEQLPEQPLPDTCWSHDLQ